MAVGALDPGVPYESRWAPCDQVHGPGQGQFPEGSIRPRGYMAPDARRSFACQCNHGPKPPALTHRPAAPTARPSPHAERGRPSIARRRAERRAAGSPLARGGPGRSGQPIATPPPMVRFSTCVVFSMRSAAELSALATATCVARARSAARRGRRATPRAPLRGCGRDGWRRPVRRTPSAPPSRSGGRRRSRRTCRAEPPIRNIQALGELQRPRLLAFLAGHAVLPAVDGDIDMAHQVSPASSTARMVPIAHPAVRRSRGWCAPVCGISPANRQARRPAGIGRRPAPGFGPPARSRRGQLRAAVPPRFPVHRAPSSAVASPRRDRRKLARRGRSRWPGDRSCETARTFREAWPHGQESRGSASV